MVADTDPKLALLREAVESLIDGFEVEFVTDPEGKLVGFQLKLVRDRPPPAAG